MLYVVTVIPAAKPASFHCETKIFPLDKQEKIENAHILLMLARKAANLVVLDRRPGAELVTPLLHRHDRGAQHEDAFLDRARSRHSHEGLASAARKHNNSRPCSAIVCVRVFG